MFSVPGRGFAAPFPVTTPAFASASSVFAAALAPLYSECVNPLATVSYTQIMPDFIWNMKCVSLSQCIHFMSSLAAIFSYTAAISSSFAELRISSFSSKPSTSAHIASSCSIFCSVLIVASAMLSKSIAFAIGAAIGRTNKNAVTASSILLTVIFIPFPLTVSASNAVFGIGLYHTQ